MPWSDDLCPPALQPTHQDIGGAACAGGGSRHRRLGGGHQLRLRETGGWQARVATRRPGWYRGAACALALLCFLQPLQAATGRASAPGEGDFSQQRFRQEPGRRHGDAVRRLRLVFSRPLVLHASRSAMWASDLRPLTAGRARCLCHLRAADAWACRRLRLQRARSQADQWHPTSRPRLVPGSI